jgi:hypothetical protein
MTLLDMVRGRCRFKRSSMQGKSTLPELGKIGYSIKFVEAER